MNSLVRSHYIEMAKLIAFLLFVCFEFSRQSEVAVVENPRDFLPAEFAFPEPQILHETYPLDISLDNEKYFLKSVEGTDTFPQEAQNSWEIAEELYDQIWEDYVEVTLDVEGWMIKAYPGMSHYKWLRVLEKGSAAKGTVPECSAEVVSIYDYYDRNDQNSWLNSDDGNAKIMEEYTKLVSDIEKWMIKANPKMSDYKWLKAIEKGTEASCVDYDAESYDYYCDTDPKAFFGDKESYKKKLQTSRKLKFKRFTSV